MWQLSHGNKFCIIPVQCGINISVTEIWFSHVGSDNVLIMQDHHQNCPVDMLLSVCISLGLNQMCKNTLSYIPLLALPPPFFPLLWLRMKSATKTQTPNNGKCSASPSYAVFKFTLDDTAAQTRKGSALACYHWCRIAKNASDSFAGMFVSWMWEATKDSKTEVLWKMWIFLTPIFISTLCVLRENMHWEQPKRIWLTTQTLELFKTYI